jgi:hypothetical protein
MNYFESLNLKKYRFLGRYFVSPNVFEPETDTISLSCLLSKKGNIYGFNFCNPSAEATSRIENIILQNIRNLCSFCPGILHHVLWSKLPVGCTTHPLPFSFFSHAHSMTRLVEGELTGNGRLHADPAKTLTSALIFVCPYQQQRRKEMRK